MNGNTLKRVLAVLVCAFMFIQCTAIGALAANIAPEAEVYVRPEVVEADINQIGMNYVYIDITTQDCRNDQPIMAYVVEQGETSVDEPLAVAYSYVSAQKSEIKIGIPDSVETGTYTMALALNKAEKLYTKSFFYADAADVTGFLEAVNAEDEAVVKEKLAAHYTAISALEFKKDAEGNVILKLKGSDYSNLSKKEKSAFAELIANGVNGIYSNAKESDLYTADNAETFVKDAFITAVYNAGEKNNAKLSELVFKFASVIGFELEDENGSTIYGNIQDRASVLKSAKAMKAEVANAVDLAKVLRDAVVIQTMNETHPHDVVDVVNKYYDVFKNDINKSQLNNLVASKALRQAFCEAFVGVYYTRDEIADAWKSAYTAAKKAVAGTTGDGVGGGVGGGDSKDEGEKVTTNVVNTQISKEENKKDPNVEIKDYYTDMSAEYYWASDAVLSLTKAGIVQGYGDKTYGPAKGVTRAEFMKMVVNVFGLADITATSSFGDVDKASWYYIYVASAEKRGIAQGYGNGLFGVNDPVTRQDALTIIYRAAMAKGISLDKFTGSTNTLIDKAEIAPYAVKAVESLYTTGVYLDATDPKSINKLEPTRNATRAYLAVILNQVYIYMN